MKVYFYLQFFTITFLLLFVFLIPGVLRGQSSDSANVNLQVTGICNFNNICETDLGETEVECPNDCGCNNNGICEAGRDENETNCPADCALPTPTPEPGTTPTPTPEPGTTPTPTPTSMPTPTPITGGSFAYLANYIKNIVATPSFNSAEISWQTEKPAICDFYLGKTQEYEKEIIFETNYKTIHAVNLDSLDLSARYHFKINCKDGSNLEIYSQDLQFKTRGIINNANNFKAEGEDGKISLTWDNPPDENFAGVIILRRTDFYPLNINDGTAIYEGARNYFEDENLVNSVTYYYAIFTEDKDNNFSSGAVASAIPHGEKPIAIISPFIPTLSTTPKIPAPTPEQVKKITIGDFSFSANGNNIPVENGSTIEVPPGESLNISADCTKFSGIKTILIEMQNNEKISSYILRQEGNEKFCNVSIIPPQNAGSYPLKILIINYKNEIIDGIIAEIKISGKNEAPLAFTGSVSLRIYMLIALAAAFLLLWFLARKRWKKMRAGFKN
jgi:hypothetical protein